MILREFIANKAARERRLVENIVHIESLPPLDFLNAIENIDKFVATEKLDGANLRFGFDEIGFYTSRSGKGGDTFRSEDDYPNTPTYNGFRAAHQALTKAADKIHRFVHDMEEVEIEVMFGQQPNAIVYGDNMIAFLRFTSSADSTEGPQRIQDLGDALDGVKVKTSTAHTVTADGLTLQNKVVDHEWRFVATHEIDHAVIRSVDLARDVAAVSAFLNASNEAVPGKTNVEVMTVKLTTFPQDLRELVKQERESLLDQFAEKFKKPIKQKLVASLLRKLKPALRSSKVDSSHDVGIEGIVFLDPETNKQFKLVDKDLFTALNKFNFAARSAIRNTGGAPNPLASVFKLSTSDQTLFDQLSTKIGRIFNLAEDLQYYNINKVLKGYGTTPQQVIDSITAALEPGVDVKQDVLSAVVACVRQLRLMLERFKSNWKTYQTTLPSGKRVTYNNEIYSRTLTSFADAHEELSTLMKAVKESNTTQELVAAVFSRQLSHLGTDVG